MSRKLPTIKEPKYSKLIRNTVLFYRSCGFKIHEIADFTEIPISTLKRNFKTELSFTPDSVRALALKNLITLLNSKDENVMLQITKHVIPSATRIREDDLSEDEITMLEKYRSYKKVEAVNGEVIK